MVQITNAANIQPGDKVFVEVGEHIDVETANAVLDELKTIFPDNSIIAINSVCVKSIQIVHESRNPFL